MLTNESLLLIFGSLCDNSLYICNHLYIYIFKFTSLHLHLYIYIFTFISLHLHLYIYIFTFPSLQPLISQKCTTVMDSCMAMGVQSFAVEHRSISKFEQIYLKSASSLWHGNKHAHHPFPHNMSILC